MVKLYKGSIFDSKCDLIIIPCNNFGGVSYTIKKGLTSNGLPHVVKNIEAGDISFLQGNGNFLTASIMGFAASVDVNKETTSEENIKQIVRKIKAYCEENSLHKVNMPLLGTGAGGLSAAKSYSIIKSEFEKAQFLSICVYAYSEDIYYELSKNDTQSHTLKVKNPRVFISYTSVDLENRNWVKMLAKRLRQNGVDARLDTFHLKPGQDLPQWMTNEIIMADKVLLICDKYYAEKADNRTGGAGWETMIIQGDMLSQPEQNKYIAILRDKDIDQSLPIYVKSKYALNWSDESQMNKEFNDFLFLLFDCDDEPPIGEIPSFIIEKLENQETSVSYH